MATTPTASPARFHLHPTSPFDSPAGSDCSVIFGAASSPSPSQLNILTPLSRRDTLVLPQGFAGQVKRLMVDSPSARTNKTQSHLLVNRSSPRLSRSPSPTKAPRFAPSPLAATPRSTRSSAGSSSNTSPDKENPNPTPRRSSRRHLNSSGESNAAFELAAASPSRNLRFSSGQRSPRKAEVDVEQVEDPVLPQVEGGVEEQAMLNEPVEQAAEVVENELVETQSDEESSDIYLHASEEDEDCSDSGDLEDIHAFSPTSHPSTAAPASFIIRRDALSYDSDELTDADAEGSYEIFSDDEEVVDVAAGESDEFDEARGAILSAELAALSLRAVEVEREALDAEDAEETESEELVEEETDVEQVIVAQPEVEVAEHESVEVQEAEREAEEREANVTKHPRMDEYAAVVEAPRSPATAQAPLPPSSTAPAAPSHLFTSIAPVDDVPAARSPEAVSRPASTPVASALPHPPSETPSRAAPTSSTPSATDTKRHAVLAAPTARRQLSKLTSKPAPRQVATTSSAGKLLSGIVPSSVAPGQRRLGTTKSALPTRASPPSTTALKRPTPKSSGLVPATTFVPGPSSLPTVPASVSRSKIAGPSKPSTMSLKPGAPSSTPSSTIRPPTRMMPPTARKTTSTADGRPSSAASNSSGSSKSSSTLVPARSRPIATKSLKPPSAGVSVAAPRIQSTTGNGIARRGLIGAPPTAARAGATLGSARSATSVSTLPARAIPSSTSSAAQAPTVPAALLPRPSPAPPSALAAARTLSILTATSSAPSILSVESRPLPTPSPAPTFMASQPTLPLLPRPMALHPTPRSPDKRSAQRIARELSADRPSAKTDAENIAPRQVAPSSSSSSLSSQSSGSGLHRTTLGPTNSLPSIPSLPLTSPAKAGRLPLSTSLPTSAKIELPSLLTTPAEKVVFVEAAAAELFAPPPSAAQELLPPPSRSTRTKRTRAATEVLAPAEPIAEPLPLLPRPTRRTRVAVVEVSALDEQVEEEPALAPARPPIIFNPAPALTQEELNRITQKNTKRNQLHFNKLDVLTIVVDSNRPPSPTSKIRRSISNEGAAGRPTTKEGREARAANRKRALRSSTDGSEAELMRREMGGEDGEERSVPTVHYRAPGDEEEFKTPARALKVLKGKGKRELTVLEEGKEAPGKSVKWDKALVYEGPLDHKSTTADGILKRIPLDPFGNSTNTATGYAKPAPVQIKKLVYRDDE